MTEEEIKAKELIKKFRNELSWIEKDYPIDLYRDAMQCALLCCKEIIKDASKTNIHLSRGGLSDYDYWQKVKKAILKQ